MGAKRQPKVGVAEQQNAILKYFRIYGHDRFHLPDGPDGEALIEAQHFGWVWMPRPECCVITKAGLAQVADRLDKRNPDVWP